MRIFLSIVSNFIPVGAGNGFSHGAKHGFGFGSGYNNYYDINFDYSYVDSDGSGCGYGSSGIYGNSKGDGFGCADQVSSALDDLRRPR